ncbi:MAG: methyltransferase domain-containing protein [Xanthobacteraceae bacterium]
MANETARIMTQGAPPAPLIFDRALIRRWRRRAAALGPVTVLLDRVAADLAERLAAVRRQFAVAVDLGTPGEAVRAALAGLGTLGTLIVLDAIAERGARRAGQMQNKIAADEEALPFREASLDLVVSALALQFVNDLPGVLVQIRRALRPDGLLLAALIGGDTLTELRQSFIAAELEREGGASPRVAPFVDVRAAGDLLQRAGFALPVADADRYTLRYQSPFALMHELRRMGAANALFERRRTPLRRATLMRMAEIYRDRFADIDGRVRATFDIVWLSGWAPHPGQQQPLKPGSAQSRLADALGTQELSAGEKAGNSE